MIICLHFERKPGYPSCDLLILNEQLMQTGAAWHVDVDQAAENTTAASEAAQTDESVAAL